MGQILSQPVTEKHSESGGDQYLAYGLSSMQGWRVNMEDAHTTILNLNKASTEIDPSLETEHAKAFLGAGTKLEKEEEEEADNNDESHNSSLDLNKSIKFIKEDDENPIAFFAVYDGHGGDKIAKFSGKNLYKVVMREDSFAKGNYSQALKDGFLATDVEILSSELLKKDQSGCTATTVIIDKTKIYCANSGDSRTILSSNGYAKALSFDHKPTNEGEKSRIYAAGGFVDMGRVNGNLALSRAIGDFDFKKNKTLPPEEQAVTAFPDIIEHDINLKNDEFVVLACDGIWDCLTSQQVVEIVRKGINDRKTLVQISEALIDICLAPTSGGAGIGCDNMSVIIVALLGDLTLEQWYESIINKAGPISQDFELISNEIFKNAAVEEAQEQSSDDSRTSFSIQQLLENNILTNQNGVFYLSNSNLLSSLGIEKNDENPEDKEEDTTHGLTEIHEDEDEEPQEAEKNES